MLIAQEFKCSPDEVRDDWSCEAFLDAEALLGEQARAKRKAQERAARKAKG